MLLEKVNLKTLDIMALRELGIPFLVNGKEVSYQNQEKIYALLEEKQYMKDYIVEGGLIKEVHYNTL